MRVLIVEDDSKIASFISKGLKEAGYAVDHVTTAEEGFSRASRTSYDAAIVDIMLPRMDGLTMIEKLRGADIRTPVLILSAKRSVDDRIQGFQKGGDDYITKPFSFAELFVRIQALIRRDSMTASPTTLSAGDLTMNLLTRNINRVGQKVELQPREFSLLEYLMRNTGNVLTKTMIMEHVWDYDFDPQTNVVDVLVSRLRTKIDRDFDKKLIHTVRGVGYVLRVD